MSHFAVSRLFNIIKRVSKNNNKKQMKEAERWKFQRSVRIFVFWKRYEGQTQTHNIRYKHMNEMQHSFKFE